MVVIYCVRKRLSQVLFISANTRQGQSCLFFCCSFHSALNSIRSFQIFLSHYTSLVLSYSELLVVTFSDCLVFLYNNLESLHCLLQALTTDCLKVYNIPPKCFPAYKLYKWYHLNLLLSSHQACWGEDNRQYILITQDWPELMPQRQSPSMLFPLKTS